MKSTIKKRKVTLLCNTMQILKGYPKKNGISIKEIADRAGINRNTLKRQLSPNDPYTFPVSYLEPFIKACGNDFEILDHLESRFNRVAVMVPTSKTALGPGSVARLAKESGEAIATYARAIKDGNIDKGEAKDCLKRLHDLTSTAMSLIRAINQINLK